MAVTYTINGQESTDNTAEDGSFILGSQETGVNVNVKLDKEYYHILQETLTIQQTCQIPTGLKIKHKGKEMWK